MSLPTIPNTQLKELVDSKSPICYGILKPGEHCPDGVPVIKVKNILGGRIIDDGLLRTTEEIHEQYKRAELQGGDILLTIRGTTGRVAIVPLHLGGANITQDTARIRVSSTDYPLFVYYALQSPQTQHQIKLNTVGQAVKGINIAEVKKLKILYPPLHEQKKIAQILSTWDKAIATTEKLLANSQQQKKALMQQLLTGKKRLLDKDGVRFSGEWVEKKLKDVIIIHYGKSPKEVISDSGKIPIYGTGGISGYAHEALCDTEAVLIGRKGTIDNPKFINVPFWPIDTTFYCTASDSVSIKWFYYVSTAIALKNYVEGSGVPSLSRDTLYSIKIKCPSQIAEQEAIASSLDACENEIERYLSLVDAFVNEKKSLMQQLLTGKRRVKTD